MNTKDYISIISLLLSLASAILIYYNSPNEISIIDGGRADTDFNAIHNSKINKQTRMKIGMGLLYFSVLLQLVAIFINNR